VTRPLLPGRTFPLGATVSPEGVNFCIFSRNGTAVELLLFDHVDDPQPARVLRLDPERNRTFYYWHILVPDLRPGQLYAYRVHGPYHPDEGLYFDGDKVLLDPYARLVMYNDSYDREAARLPGDNVAHCLKGVVLDPRGFDWEGDRRPQRLLAETVLYELHVRGFTRHPSSGVAPPRAGTYVGLIEKIPYLQDLGVTAVELLPVQQFDAPGPGRTDYWGYNPIAFFAPHRGYSSRSDPLGPADEFREMVKAMHRAGLEVILDVVFNHTAEGDASGPTLSFRGLENRAYYIPANGRAGYANYSGCGNTVNGNHSIVRRLILDCLRYWVQVMHVDGFRFDLASVLARDEAGRPLVSPPILWEIESDPVLAGTKLIAEAWDAGGLYQVGTFVGHRWAEWNGPFRDGVRRFIKGDTGTVLPLASSLVGNPDLFPQPDRDPHRSINFITCHDGFTLWDLVSYDRKHNDANGEDNRDGTNANYSWNTGHEGPTADTDINTLRLRQMKNFLTVLLLAHGTPMLLMGDETARTQRGNNNAYCQDNEISWLDWNDLTRADLRRFLRKLIHFRREHAIFAATRFWSSLGDPAAPRVTWHGVEPFHPDWGHDSHSLALTVSSPTGEECIYVALNAYWEPLDFHLPPPVAGTRWHRVVDTALPSPQDIVSPRTQEPVYETVYRVKARAAVVLIHRFAHA
jgi:glycogen operon protein